MSSPSQLISWILLIMIPITSCFLQLHKPNHIVHIPLYHNHPRIRTTLESNDRLSRIYTMSIEIGDNNVPIPSTSSASTQTNSIEMEGNVEDTDIIDTSVPSTSFIGTIKRNMNLLYKFSRPHTIKGTILASIMGVTRALLDNPGKLSFKLIPRAMFGLFALLCGNAYIVGINQIYDVKIDEINKPYLPIAAKSLSNQKAWYIVMACLVSGVSIVKTLFSPVIFKLYVLGLLLGTSYSVPPLQLKRIPICAGTIIAFVRGFLLNTGVYYAVREALQVKFSWNPVVTFVASFMTLFASVIAVTKDLSDVEGDIKYNIDTFAAKYGVRKISIAASALLLSAYAGAITLPFLMPGSFNMIPMVAGHSIFSLYFLHNAITLNPKDAKSIRRFYKAIWNVFYLEYCLYPFI